MSAAGESAGAIAHRPCHHLDAQPLEGSGDTPLTLLAITGVNRAVAVPGKASQHGGDIDGIEGEAVGLRHGQQVLQSR